MDDSSWAKTAASVSGGSIAGINDAGQLVGDVSDANGQHVYLANPEFTITAGQTLEPTRSTRRRT